MTATTERLDRSAPSAPTLRIDWTRCDGHGLCALALPERISLDDWGFPIVREATVAPEQVPKTLRTVGLCPALALRLDPA